MDNFFDVAYERDEAGKRHHYLAVRWNHRLQGQWDSYAISGLASMRAYAVSNGGCFQPTVHVVNREIGVSSCLRNICLNRWKKQSR